MKTNNKKILLLDYDGVIVNSFPALVDAILREKDNYNVPLHTREDIQKVFQGNYYEEVRSLGVSPETLAGFGTAVHVHLDEGFDSMPPFPGMLDLIKKLSNFPTKGIVSSNGSDAIIRFLKAHAIHDYFQEILGVDIDESKVVKIQSVIDKYQIDPKNIYFVTDTAGDVEEGQKTNVHTIAVTWGFHKKKILQKASPDYIIDNVEQLSKFLKSL